MVYIILRPCFAIAFTLFVWSHALSVSAQQQQQGQNTTTSSTIQPAANTTTAHGTNATSISSNTSTAVNHTQTTASATPTTFPIASYPSTGALQGTAQAPFPANGKFGNGNALGPDDSYIAAALALVPSIAIATCAILALSMGIWLL